MTCCTVEQMHDILARELMKKSRGLMAKYNQLLLRDEQVNMKHVYVISVCDDDNNYFLGTYETYVDESVCVAQLGLSTQCK